MAITFDFDDLTALSESDPRLGDYDTLQVHHTVTTTYAAARSLMDAGGRTVSANGLMTPDGRLGRVVPLERRAFTSASVFDHRSLTVECCNTTGGPEYGISLETHMRLGQTLGEMVKEGRSGLFYGPGGLIYHRDIPGTYATVCPGPSMESDLILSFAKNYVEGNDMLRETLVVVTPTTDWVNRPKDRWLIITGIFWIEVGPEEVGQYQAMWNTNAARLTVSEKMWNTIKKGPNAMLLGQGGGGGGTPDLTPILQAIAAGEAQDAKDVAAVLAKLDGVDEAVADQIAKRLVS